MKFVFVDEVLELVPDERVLAITHITHDEPYFADHFPGFPVVPGVLLTEMMGQAAAKCLDIDLKNRGKAVLARIVSANFRDWVCPGQTIRLFANIRSLQKRFSTADCKAEVDDKQIATAELLFTFVPLNEFPHNFQDDILAKFS